MALCGAAVCWLNLANAYGSVHHNLIPFALRHYHVLDYFIALVNNLYHGLCASICSHSWSTATFPLEVGVFQGDPLSVTVFNTVMNTYIDSVRPFFHEGYCFHISTKQLSLLQYADDTCIVTNDPATCQASLRRTDQRLEWSKMRANVSKCQCLALKASTGRVYDPNLSIAGEKIPSVGKQSSEIPGWHHPDT